MDTNKTVTDAPLAYDGFGTITTTVLGVDKDDKIWRVVRTPSEHLTWQRMRYASGSNVVLGIHQVDDIAHLMRHQAVEDSGDGLSLIALLCREDNPRFAHEESLGRDDRGKCATEGPFCGEDHFVPHFSVHAAQGHGLKFSLRVGQVALFDICAIDRLYFPELKNTHALAIWAEDGGPRYHKISHDFDWAVDHYTEAQEKQQAERVVQRKCNRKITANLARAMSDAIKAVVRAEKEALAYDEDDGIYLPEGCNMDLFVLTMEAAAWADNVQIWSGELDDE